MPFAFGPIAGNLRAFGKVGEVKPIGIPIGHAHDIDDPVHHPIRVFNIIEPNEIGAAQVVVLFTPDKLCIIGRDRAHQIKDAVAVICRKSVGHRVHSDHGRPFLY